MSETLKALVQHLRRNKKNIVETVRFSAKDHDPTYGLVTRSFSIEVVDFDNLLDEIDNFAKTFKEN